MSCRGTTSPLSAPPVQTFIRPLLYLRYLEVQNYMTKFARRAADVAGIEREEARAAAAEAAATASSESSAVYEEGSLQLSVGSTDADAFETGTDL